MGFISPAEGVTMPWRSASGSLAKATSIAILERHEPGHGVRARAVHADLAVVIDGHEREGRIERRIDDRDVQAVDGVDRLPVGHGRAAERIDAELQAGGANRVHVDDVDADRST